MSPAPNIAPVAQPRWLNLDELALWQRLHALAEIVPAVIDNQLRTDSGLNRYEYYVLAMLSEAPGRSRLMSDLAVVTNGSQSRLSHAANRLERRGWITRSLVSGNRRSTVATLTDAGWNKVVDTAPGHVEAVRRLLLDGLTAQQVSALTSALSPLIASLDIPALREPPVAAQTDKDSR